MLTGEVTGHQQRTPYARWMAVTGLWPLAAWALVVLGLALWQRRRGKLPLRHVLISADPNPSQTLYTAAHICN